MFFVATMRYLQTVGVVLDYLFVWILSQAKFLDFARLSGQMSDYDFEVWP